MRLIDADKLCEEFKRRQTAALNWKEQAIMNDDLEIEIRADAVLGFLSEVKLTIDKAPTVELFCSYLSDGEVRQPCVEAPCKHERPTGEWLEDSGNIACSNCHTIWLYRRTNYCPNCGADMRGAEE